MACPTGFVEITINSGWCVETTTNADIIKVIILVISVAIVTCILSKSKKYQAKKK